MARAPAAVSPLGRAIRDRIRSHGPIPVAEYMALAVAHPDHGYYRVREPFGTDGDFVTAPEIAQAFGEVIGLWCAVAWRLGGEPAPINLVELGPGRGTLMADALRAARTVPEFHAALRVHLVETSPALRERQRRALRDVAVEWHDSVSTVPQGPAIWVANEFFDALPVRQYVRMGGAWRERLVGIDGEHLCFVAAGHPAPEAIAFPAAVQDAPEGMLFERCPAALALVAEIARRLAADGVAALIVDYGPARSAPGESLQAVRGHEYHDVLQDPGEADLTAHVDFESLAEAAKGSGAVVFGPIPQGLFLGRLGISLRTERLAARATPGQAAALRESCRRLIAEDEMGTLFKALALARPGLGAPAGFEHGQSV